MLDHIGEVALRVAIVVHRTWGCSSGVASFWVVGTHRSVCLQMSDAGDVGGEEVDAVAVEVAAGSVVVLGGAGVGVPGEDLRVS